MSEPRSIPLEYQIGRHMMGLWVPQAIHAAAELGVADALVKGPLAASDLASLLGTHPEATARLLHALAVLGIVEGKAGTFALTELGRYLTDDAPGSRRAWARLMGGGPVWRAWGQLTECVRTGRPAWTADGGERSSETEVFDALASDPESAGVFHRAMADGTRGAAPSIVAAAELGEARTVIDVGGGHGALLAAALEAHPKLEGGVFDLEHARAGATKLFASRGLEARARFTAGDLFTEDPPSADVLLLKSVIHDWGDERSVAILRRCAAAIGERGKLVVVEPPAPEPGADVPASFAWIVAFSDLNMLVNTGGRERTASEYTRLLEQAGLQVRAVRPTGAFYTCFEATRA
ncbi:MAG: hypothetical protein KF795_21490 [Labilithrix sp.]|nr:hypothetical protein [Labilithrix sp.]